MNVECSFESGSFFTIVDLWDESFGGLIRRMTTVVLSAPLRAKGEVFSPFFVTFRVFLMCG